MRNFISAENVFTNQPVTNRIDVLKDIARKAERLGITNDAQAVFDAFLWREQQSETGMQDGFAIPHAKSDAIFHAAVIVYKTKEPLPWPSFDGQPVDISIALLVPEAEAGTTHIKLLSKTATLLMDPHVRKQIRSTTDSELLAQLIDKGVQDSPSDIDDES